MTEDEMVGWCHGLEGHEFEQAPGGDEAQGSLACCSPWDYKAEKEAGSRTQLSCLCILPIKYSDQRWGMCHVQTSKTVCAC